jgi:hypothetical protein
MRVMKQSEPLEQGRQDFDLVGLRTVGQLRFFFGETSVKSVAGEIRQYETATVIVVHSRLSEAMRSNLHYVGPDRERWLTKGMEVLPISLVKGG